jgi:acid phosphatase type 7
MSLNYLIGFLLLVFLSSGSASPAQKPSKGKTRNQQPAALPVSKSKQANRTQVLVGAGDISSCNDLEGARATANLIEKIPGTVFAAGDLVYERGTSYELTHCYDPTWGQFKERTRPALGNHEYLTRGAAPYFAYWGERAGPAGKGYYSYDLGAWHIVVLNTNCDQKDLGGCGTGSTQETWLRKDLASHSNACILAYGHHALFSSGISAKHAIHPELRQIWRDLYQAHADLVLAGHEHSYERFAPQDPDGVRDDAHGIREIVAGTGGKDHGPLGFAVANSEVRDWTTFGVLKVTLGPESYSWEFIPVEGKSFRDSGNGTCHNSPPRN